MTSSYIHFVLYKCRRGGKLQKRGKINLIGRLQLTTEKTKEEDNEGIVALRVLRTQVGGDQLSSHLPRFHSFRFSREVTFYKVYYWGYM